MSLATTVRAMELAGCTAKQIADVVVAHQDAEEARRSEKRAADAARQRKSRASRNVTVTERDSQPVTVTPPTLKDPLPNLVTVEVNPNPPPDSPPARVKPDLGVGEVWEAYPRRQGGNSRKNAEASFRKAVKSGVDAATILDGVRAYAEHCDATGKTRTEFVKTTEAWLNGRYWESDWSISLSRPAPPHRQARRNTALEGLEELERRFANNAPPTLRIAG